MTRMPIIELSLIEYLEGICPDQAPSLSTPERKVWFDAGKADLVKHLRHIYTEQNENILEQGN